MGLPILGHIFGDRLRAKFTPHQCRPVNGQTSPLLKDSSVSALELSKESSPLPSLVVSFKSFHDAAEAGNFIVEEFLQRSKARSFIGTNQVECYSKLKAFLSGNK